MSLDNRPSYSGGCQCGKVRFHVEGALGQASVCHCRMCQKAFGGFYAPLVSLGEGAKLRWAHGEPERFRSSNHVERGFCAACGTPLTYEAPDGVALAIGAFDDPASIRPVVQFGREAALPYVDDLPSLPSRRSEEDAESHAFLRDVVSFQHPDHDTDAWPPNASPPTDERTAR